MIRFENVSKTFRGNGKQVEAIKEVSLHIKKGEIFGFCLFFFFLFLIFRPLILEPTMIHMARFFQNLKATGNR